MGMVKQLRAHTELSTIDRGSTQCIFRKKMCAVRNILRKTQNSALILEKRCALMPHELASQAGEVVLQADDNFLKIGRIVATFLKIVRIFQNRDVLGVILRREYVRRNKYAPHPQFRKIRHKIRK